MPGLVLAGMLAVLAAATTISDRVRTPRADSADPRARGWAFVAFGATWVLPPLVALVCFASVSVVDYGPPRPADPFRGSDTWSLDLDLGGALAAVALGVVGVLLLCGLALYFIGARGAKRRSLGVPSGQLTARAFTAVALLITLLAAARIAIGGAEPHELRWHGSLVVPGDDGWRANATVRRLATGPWHEVQQGAPVPDDVTRWSGSDCCGALASPGGARLSDGVHAWVSDAPVLLVLEDDRVTMHPVDERAPDLLEDRPRFLGVPRWSPVRPRGDLSPEYDHRALLVDEHDGLRAVLIGTSDTYAPTTSEVGLVGRAPGWPWLAVVPLWLVAAACRRRARRPAIEGPRRLASALALALVTALLLGAYAPSFGLG